SGGWDIVLAVAAATTLAFLRIVGGYVDDLRHSTGIRHGNHFRSRRWFLRNHRCHRGRRRRRTAAMREKENEREEQETFHGARYVRLPRHFGKPPCFTSGSRLAVNIARSLSRQAIRDLRSFRKIEIKDSHGVDRVARGIV